MNNPRILVGGIGNIFFGDDAFGEIECTGDRVQAQPGAVTVTQYVSYLAHA